MLVLDERVDGDFLASRARCDDRELTFERNECLDDQSAALGGAQVGECAIDRGVEIGRRLEPRLALAVVAEASRLDHARRADCLDRRVQFFARVGESIGRHRHADALEHLLLVLAILADRERSRRRRNANVVEQPLRGGRRHVLELERHDRATVRKAPQRFGVVVGALHQFRDVRGRRVGRRVEDLEAQPERRAGERQHARELPAAEDADHVSASPCEGRCRRARRRSPSCGARAHVRATQSRTMRGCSLPSNPR